MGKDTGIEWADDTWNPIVGCFPKSPGCTNCYAMKMAGRIVAAQPLSHYRDTVQFVNGSPVWTGRIGLAPPHLWNLPKRLRGQRRIFVNSMGDLFHDAVPTDLIDRVFAEMQESPQHTFLVLTKSVERMHDYVTMLQRRIGLAYGPETLSQFKWPLPHVWLGVSVENQMYADQRLPLLATTPAAKRFISAEPLLGRVQLALENIDMVIVGGESGPGARPMHTEWARSIRDQCAAAGVAFFMKQMGGRVMSRMPAIPDDLNIKEFPAP